jgi:pilus assembly protein CpaF
MTDPANDVELLERVRHRLARTAQPVGAAPRGSGAIGDDAALADLERHISAELVGAGPLEPLLDLPGVTDVLVNGPDEVWIDRGGLVLTSVRFPDDGAVRRLAQRLAAATGRRLDDASPFVDATLPDGTRLHAILPPLVPHPTLSLRILARRRFTLADLVVAGAIDAAVAGLLEAIVGARLAFVIAGGTGTGKTTLLGALLSCCRADERVVLIEDAAEVVTTHPHLVRLTCRTANVEGAGAIGPAELVRQALRMRPDRLVVGEFRGAEFGELLGALNTGHDGGAATMHANAAGDVPARFAALGSLARLDSGAVTLQVASAFAVVIALRRDRDGRRRVTELAVVAPPDATLSGAGDRALRLLPVWPDPGPGFGRARLAQLLADRGYPIPGLLR